MMRKQLGFIFQGTKVLAWFNHNDLDVGIGRPKRSWSNVPLHRQGNQFNLTISDAHVDLGKLDSLQDQLQNELTIIVPVIVNGEKRLNVYNRALITSYGVNIERGKFLIVSDLKLICESDSQERFPFPYTTEPDETKVSSKPLQ